MIHRLAANKKKKSHEYNNIKRGRLKRKCIVREGVIEKKEALLIGMKGW